MVIDRVVYFYKEACGFGFPLYNTPPKWLGELPSPPSKAQPWRASQNAAAFLETIF